MKKPFRIRKACIVGLGLMGGSLGLALRRSGMAQSVAGFARRADTRKKALAEGVVDVVFDDVREAVKGADIVVLCTPVATVAPLARGCVDFLDESSLLMDVGSSKRKIVSDLDRLFRKKKAAFVGAHPIAGSERQGLAAASADLYRGAVVVLTPTKWTCPKGLFKAHSFWTSLGARIALASPKEHDDLLARTSHLPHLVSAILAAHVGRGKAARLRDFRGPGFLDATRIAEGSPELWAEIIMSNLPSIRRELELFSKQVEAAKNLVATGRESSLRRYLDTARQRRRGLI